MSIDVIIAHVDLRLIREPEAHLNVLHWKFLVIISLRLPFLYDTTQLQYVYLIVMAVVDSEETREFFFSVSLGVYLDLLRSM